jgi:hypothetical protein
MIAIESQTSTSDRSAVRILERPIPEEGPALALRAGVVDVAQMDDVVCTLGDSELTKTLGMYVICAPVAKKGDLACVGDLNPTGCGGSLEGIFVVKMLKDATDTGGYPDDGVSLAGGLEFGDDVVLDL